jgi:hypothetical protein
MRQTIANQTIREPIVVSNGTTPPSHGLFQVPYSLAEADFVRLRTPSPALVAAGGAAVSFGLSFALPVLVEFLIEGKKPGLSQLLVSGLSIGGGSLLLVLSWFVSRERKRLIKSIREHFSEHRPQMQYFVPGGQQ